MASGGLPGDQKRQFSGHARPASRASQGILSAAHTGRIIAAPTSASHSGPHPPPTPRPHSHRIAPHRTALHRTVRQFGVPLLAATDSRDNPRHHRRPGAVDQVGVSAPLLYFGTCPPGYYSAVCVDYLPRSYEGGRETIGLGVVLGVLGCDVLPARSPVSDGEKRRGAQPTLGLGWVGVRHTRCTKPPSRHMHPFPGIVAACYRGFPSSCGRIQTRRQWHQATTRIAAHTRLTWHTSRLGPRSTPLAPWPRGSPPLHPLLIRDRVSIERERRRG